MSSSVGHNSLVMAVGTAASRITGQIRTILLAAAVGTTGLAANAYQAGSQIPQVVFTLVSGGIFNAVLVPQIVRTLKSKNAEEQLNKLITFAIVLLLAVTGIVAALAAPLTRLYVDGGSDMLALSTSFTLWCVPQIFFYGLYTVVGQILAAKDHFGTYAWSSVGANVISCIGFTIFILMFGKADRQPLGFWTSGKIALSAGTWTLGVAFQALVLFLPLRKIGIHYRPKFGIHGIGLRQMGPVAAWSLGIVFVDQIATIINTRITTSAPLKAHETLGTSLFDVAGNASYQNAYTIYILPYSLIAVSVATAIFPRISQAVADRHFDAARAGLSNSLRNVWLLMSFFTAVFVVMPAPITLALLPSVSVKEALLMSGPLITLAFSLPLSSVYLIIQRTFYAFEDGYHPFLFIVLQAGTQVALLLLGCLVFRPDNWTALLGFTLSISYLLPFPTLVIMLRKRFGGRIDGAHLLRTFAKGVIALVVAIAGGLLLRHPAYDMFGANLEAHTGHMNWVQAVGVCAVLAIVVVLLYVGTLWALRASELVTGVNALKRKAHQLLRRGDESTASHTPAAVAGNTSYSASPMDRMSTTGKPPVNHLRSRVGNTMEPQPGDVALKRYTLVSQLRSAPGLQAWKVNDQVLARDLQLFIVTDRKISENVENVASSLALSRSDRFTQVVQIKSVGNTNLLVTHLDQGVTLTDYFGQSDNGRTLDYEAMRSIVGETAEGLRQLLDDSISLNALTTDMVRITTRGVQIADAPVSSMFIDPLESSHMQPEQVAIRQVASLLYAMLTNHALDVRTGYDLSALKGDVPEEFQVICQRGLTVTYKGDTPTIAMVSLGELVALLGDWKPLRKLDPKHLTGPKSGGQSSVEIAKLRGSDPHDIVKLPNGLVTSTGTPAKPVAPVSIAKANNSNTSMPGAAKPDTAKPQGSGADNKGTGSEGSGKTNDRTSEAENARSAAKSTKPTPAQSVRPAASAAAATQAVKVLRPVDAAKPGRRHKPSRPGKSNKPAKAWGPVAYDGNSADMDLHDMTAAEMADALKPVDSYAEDTLFPGFDDTGNFTGQTLQFDFGNGEAQVHTDGTPGAIGIETTGRMPILGPDGMAIEPGDESARALRAEKKAAEEAGSEIMPPSFTPEPADPKSGSSVLGKKPRGKANTRTIIIAAVAAVLVIVLGFTFVALHGRGGSAGAGSSQSSDPWPNMDVDKVPFSGNADEDGSGASPEKAKTPKPSKPAPKPANTTPYTVDNQQFLTNPDGQQGYGYYMHLSQPEQVSRFVVTIRSSGGNGTLIANSAHNPKDGQQVAQFTFDQSGTTEVKLKTKVQAQDFILWVPIDSLPNNQLYIEKVQFF